MKKITFLLALLTASLSFGQIAINELDADQTGTDTMEFIELSAAPNFSLDGYVVVLFNGSNDLSYSDAIDLTGFSTDANGFFIIGGDAVPGVDIALGADNVIQNGADAVAIYQAAASSFPSGSATTTTGLIDALVYGTNDDDDLELLTGLGETVQYNEDANNNGADTESIQRASDGTYCVGLPTLRATNIDCGSVCDLNLFVVSVSCDAVTSGVDTYTTTLGFTGGGTETYTINSTAGTVGGDDPSTAVTGEILITGINEGVNFDYTVTSTLCDFSNTINAPTCEPTANVATIAELRAGVIGNSYVLTGEAILTFQQAFRSQKFIEDATAAILIDDNNDIITTTYAIGDGLTGIAGTLGEFNGMIQFSPSADPGAPSSTANTITPQVVSIATLAANPGDYESEYVQIEQDVVIDNSANTNWTVGTVFPLSNGGGSFNFRTSFFDADYIDQVVPTTQSTIAGIITEREDDGGYYITARDGQDADTILGLNDNDLSALSIYPNPANDFINIGSQNEGAITVTVFNVLGKQVIATQNTNRLNITNLTSGVYLVQLTQGDATTTKKLVVK